MFFFFFKQKTAYEMRISDWSSDVCSSDLWSISMSGRWNGGNPEHSITPWAANIASGILRNRSAPCCVVRPEAYRCPTFPDPTAHWPAAPAGRGRDDLNPSWDGGPQVPIFSAT